MTSSVDRELSWGRPDGRPFDPEWLTLEEWIRLYGYLPPPGDGPDYIRVMVPSNLRAYAVPMDSAIEEQAVEFSSVGFHGRSYYTCGRKGYLWEPEGMSSDVRKQLVTAGLMNPIGNHYAY